MPSRTARVRSPATSDPAAGSEKSWHQISSPRTARARHDDGKPRVDIDIKGNLTDREKLLNRFGDYLKNGTLTLANTNLSMPKDAALRELPEVRYTVTTINSGFAQGKIYATVYVRLKDRKDRTRNATEMSVPLRERLAQITQARPDLPPPSNPTPEEQRYQVEIRHWLKEETGYQAIQGTRPQTLAFAHLAIDECENLHHASELRAGPIAALLDRVQARERPERFTQLLQLCACDWAAFDGHHQGEYPKALIWRRALQASAGVDVSGLDAEAASEARAQAVAAALGSRVRR